MKLPQHFFFYACILKFLIFAPLFIWNPATCEESDEYHFFATAAFAVEARSSRLLFGSFMAILAASIAPLADALVDLWRYWSGLSSPDKSPYTWHVDNTASAVYLAERLSVLLVYDVMAILGLVVTNPGSNYGPEVIYNVLHGGGMSCYLLTSGLFLSVSRTSAGSVVTDTVGLWIFGIHLACGTVYYWSCNNLIAGKIAFAVEMMITLYLFGLVFRDYFKDNGDGDMQKSYLKAVSLTYASAFVTYAVAAISAAAIYHSSFIRFPIVRFIAAVYIAMTCTYLASPKWRQELFQTVHLRKTMHDMQASRRLHDQLETRAETEAAIAARTTATSLLSISEGQTAGDDDGIEGGLLLKPQPILHRISHCW
jgi:hypothetical protein